jgi:hypothetical protein
MTVDEFKEELLRARKSINAMLKVIDSNPELLESINSTEKKNSEKIAGFAEDIMVSWNKGIGAQCKVTDGYKRMLRARLKTFSEDEIRQAVENRIDYVNNSSFHSSNRNVKIDIGFVLKNDGELDKYLNLGGKVKTSQGELFKIEEIKMGDTSRSILE